jgi:hypothetical protein
MVEFGLNAVIFELLKHWSRCILLQKSRPRLRAFLPTHARLHEQNIAIGIIQLIQKRLSFGKL